LQKFLILELSEHKTAKQEMQPTTAYGVRYCGIGTNPSTKYTLCAASTSVPRLPNSKLVAKKILDASVQISIRMPLNSLPNRYSHQKQGRMQTRLPTMAPASSAMGSASFTSVGPGVTGPGAGYTTGTILSSPGHSPTALRASFQPRLTKIRSLYIAGVDRRLSEIEATKTLSLADGRTAGVEVVVLVWRFSQTRVTATSVG
jgi:hypothetical protein